MKIIEKAKYYMCVRDVRLFFRSLIPYKELPYFKTLNLPRSSSFPLLFFHTLAFTILAELLYFFQAIFLQFLTFPTRAITPFWLLDALVSPFWLFSCLTLRSLLHSLALSWLHSDSSPIFHFLSLSWVFLALFMIYCLSNLVPFWPFAARSPLSGYPPVWPFDRSDSSSFLLLDDFEPTLRLYPGSFHDLLPLCSCSILAPLDIICSGSHSGFFRREGYYFVN